MVKLVNLMILDLSRSGIVGFVPTEIGQTQSLTALVLDGTFNLRGTLSTEIGNISNVQVLQLFNSDIEKAQYQQSLASNLLGGEIPTEIGILASLYQLLLRSDRTSITEVSIDYSESFLRAVAF
jgi:hypothetical protein